ncbi:MAG TPA: ABC transporter substrate-binding protein [Opitutaceae bacterium]|nr:ABC transporter substrate-binding protein [Opitutaceae bacterium]
MHHGVRCIRWLTTALAAFAFCTSLRAQAPAEDPAPALLKTIDSVVDMVVGQSPETITSRVDQIRAKMDESFATEAIVHRAFGANWSKLSPAQQKEVIDLLGRVIIRTYATQMSEAQKPVIKVVSSKLITPERREIATTATTAAGKTVNIVYRLFPQNGKWMVYDVLAENVSVVGNYRQQFDAHFQKKNADDLIKMLREKLTAPIPPAPPEKAK